jgi:glutamate/tyrosine decarboxylase-like PLP-dependent enzyme/glutathione synthase/RimK-type ligase-like ATP-grasp enzyme
MLETITACALRATHIRTMHLPIDAPDTSLDPQDWQTLRQQGHRMLDDMFDYIQHIRERPVWQPIPSDVRQAFCEPLPTQPVSLEHAHSRFMAQVLPYAVGNTHPAFMGWVHGGGTPVGMLAEMLAAGLNANLGGRDQMPLEVERQIGLWMRDLFGLPETAAGLFVTGSSTANLMGVLVARTKALGVSSRSSGLNALQSQLIAYAASSAHGCIAKAMDMCGLGTQALHLVPVNGQGQMDVNALSQMIVADRAAGLHPFFVVGTAGTVNIGAIDPLDEIASVARQQGMWFHVDGALGALGMMSPDVAPKLKGIALADSIALDFHKWGQVPYDAGYFLVRNGADQLDAFASPAAYLARHSRGLAAGSPWPCDFGPDLSRSFRALKAWFTFVCHGTDKLGAVISHTCALAQYMARRIAATPELELMAPVALNIVCFRFFCDDANRVNSDIVVALHESGVAVPSATTVDGHTVIRAAIVNHRTLSTEIDALLEAAVAFGKAWQMPAQHTNPIVEKTPMNPPSPPLMGLARLMRMAFEGQSLMPLANTFKTRAEQDPADANALMDLATALQLHGLRDVGLATLSVAMQTQRVYELPAQRSPALRLLAIMGPGDLMANTPLPFLLENADISLTMLYLLPGESMPARLPEHDVVFIAISETSQTHDLLAQLAQEVHRWPKPVLVQPEGILRTSRESAYETLKDAPGVYVPPTAQASRQALEELCSGRGSLSDVLPGGTFPLIIRPLDSHAGHGLEKVDDVKALSRYLAASDETHFFIATFVDYSGPDGLFRKYRVVLIDGVPFAGHMGVSSHWMIHYLNAGMADSAEKRAEEEVFMRDFDTSFAQRHRVSLRNVYERFGLDYLVMDCAETPDGALFVFEADVGAVVHSMDPPDMFPYKVPAMQKVFDAFRALLLRTATAGKNPL